jgi:parallel beta-helix repeat protein
MVRTRAELGALIYPKTKRKLSWWFIFQLLGLFFTFNAWIFNYISGNLLFSIIGFLMFLYFSVRIFFVRIRIFKIYEKGFDAAPKIHQSIFQKIPGLVHINDIQAISPELISGKKKISTYNYKFFLDKKRFFALPIYDNDEYEKHAKATFKHEWGVLLDENFDVENIDWEFIRKNIGFTVGQSLFYFMAPPIILYSFILFYLYYYLQPDIIIDQPTFLLWLIMPILYILAVTSIRFYANIDQKLVVLRRFILHKGLDKVPEDILLSAEFRKWVYRDNLVKIIDLSYVDKLKDQYLVVSTKGARGKPITYYQYKLRGIRLQFIVMVTLLGIFMWVLSYFSFYALSSQSDVYSVNKDGVPNSGSYFFINESTIENDLIEIHDNLIVAPGGKITLKNVTLTWDLSKAGAGGLYVDLDGSLKARNCIFKSADSKETIKCELYGKAEFIDCEFYNLWGDRDDMAGQGGIEIYSDDVILDRCYIYKAHVAGIVIGKYSPVISNCTIRKCHDDGIEVQGGNAKIYNNTVKDNGNNGIMVYFGSKAIIENNTITGNDDNGIGILGTSKPKLINNHISKNGHDNIYRGEKSNPFCFWVVPIALIPLYVLLPYGVYRKDIRELREEMQGRKKDDEKG